MAKSKLGDIPGARFQLAPVTHASVASNGGNARLGQLGPFSDNVRIRAVWWAPTGAALAVSTATSTATYRRLTAYNGGTSGTASATVIGSKNLTASVAQYGTVGMTIDTTATVAAGGIVFFSQETVGGTDANGTVLVAGQLSCEYEVC